MATNLSSAAAERGRGRYSAAWASRFTAFAGSASVTAMRRGLAGLTLAMSVVWGIRAWIGCPPIGYALQDSIFALIIPERIVQGQMPVRDYSGACLILSSLPGAAGILLTGCRGLAITVGYLIAAPAFVAAAWQLARVRFSAFMAAILTLMVGVMTVATNAPGGLRGTYAMHYNRLGWVLFTLVALQAFVPPRQRPSGRRATWEALLSGACTAALLFLKLNYFAAAGLTLAIGLALFRHVRQGLGGAILGFALVLATILAFLHFNAAGFVDDLVVMSKIVGGRKLLVMLIQMLPETLPWVALAAIPFLAIIGPVVRQATAERRLTDNVRMTLAAMILLPAGILTCSMNHQHLGIPSIALAAVVLSEVGLRTEPLTGQTSNAWAGSRICVCFLVAVVSFAPTLGLDMFAMGLACKQRVFDVPSAPGRARFESAALADFVCLPQVGEPLEAEEVFRKIREGNDGRLGPTSYQYAVILNDGLDLLSPHVRTRDRVLCFDQVNPFPLAFGLEYIPGEYLWCEIHSDMEGLPCPLPEQVLHKATLVMEPKCPLFPATVDYLMSIHELTLRKEFENVAQSRFWTLWRRRH